MENVSYTYHHFYFLMLKYLEQKLLFKFKVEPSLDGYAKSRQKSICYQAICESYCSLVEVKKPVYISEPVAILFILTNFHYYKVLQW